MLCPSVQVCFPRGEILRSRDFDALGLVGLLRVDRQQHGQAGERPDRRPGKNSRQPIHRLPAPNAPFGSLLFVLLGVSIYYLSLLSFDKCLGAPRGPAPGGVRLSLLLGTGLASSPDVAVDDNLYGLHGVRPAQSEREPDVQGLLDLVGGCSRCSRSQGGAPTTGLG